MSEFHGGEFDFGDRGLPYSSWKLKVIYCLTKKPDCVLVSAPPLILTNKDNAFLKQIVHSSSYSLL